MSDGEFERVYAIGRGSGINIGLARGTAEGSNKVAVCAVALIEAAKALVEQKSENIEVFLDIALNILKKEKIEEIYDLIDLSNFSDEGIMALFHWMCPMSKGTADTTPSCVSGGGGSACGYFGGTMVVRGRDYIVCYHEKNRVGDIKQ